ncbi:hypothetical protein [Hymenobacter ruber]
METIYHWVGFAVTWAAALALAGFVLYFGAGLLWELWLSKIRNQPTTWAFYYVKRALGYYKYRKGYFAGGLRLNFPEVRALSKQKMPLVRDMQANIIRYNRRRWLAA